MDLPLMLKPAREITFVVLKLKYMKDGLTCFRKIMYTGASIQGIPSGPKCPLNGGWAGVCL